MSLVLRMLAFIFLLATIRLSMAVEMWAYALSGLTASLAVNCTIKAALVAFRQEQR